MGDAGVSFFPEGDNETAEVISGYGCNVVTLKTGKILK